MLDGITQENYFSYPAISRSDIVNFKVDPLEFWVNSIFNPDRIPDKETPAMRFGSILHTLLLEPEKEKDFLICDYGVSTINKKYQQFVDENPGRIIVNEEEFKKACNIIQTLIDSPQWAFTKKMKCIGTELPYVDKFYGLDIKCKLDALYKDGDRYVIVDYKSSSDVPMTLRTGANMGYGCQSALYRIITASVYGIPDSLVDFVFVIQDKNQPQRIKLARFSSDNYLSELDYLYYACPLIKSLLDRYARGEKDVFLPKSQDVEEFIDYGTKFTNIGVEF
jgi:exodeoxyribonuclease VIII